jgi:hypothetical protein
VIFKGANDMLFGKPGENSSTEFSKGLVVLYFLIAL